MVFERLKKKKDDRAKGGVGGDGGAGEEKKSKQNRQNANFQRLRHSWTEQAQDLWKEMETAWMQIKSPSFLQILS